MNSAQLMEHFDILVGLDNNPILDKYFYLTSPRVEQQLSWKTRARPTYQAKKTLTNLIW
ncbi:Uncharacterised protein [Yersinia intermedia]|nr:Uncharacterised protein [Yersinia intermedia]